MDNKQNIEKPTAIHVTTGDLGAIVLALNYMTPRGRIEEYAALKDRLTRTFAKRHPIAYNLYVAEGDIEPFTEAVTIVERRPVEAV